MTTTDSWQQQYSKYLDYPKFSRYCIEHLINNNEDIWRLLKYPTPDALSKPNLTYAEKAAMIYKGQEDATLSNVFLDIGQPDVFTKEMAIIRICPYAIRPDNRIYGTLLMSFEVYAHNKINTLDNYQTRIDTIAGEFLKVFNGAMLQGGIGRLYFDLMEDLNNRLANSGQLPYKGKQILMSNKTA